jgi:hypothetical protein
MALWRPVPSVAVFLAITIRDSVSGGAGRVAGGGIRRGRHGNRRGDVLVARASLGRHRPRRSAGSGGDNRSVGRASVKALPSPLFGGAIEVSINYSGVRSTGEPEPAPFESHVSAINVAVGRRRSAA